MTTPEHSPQATAGTGDRESAWHIEPELLAHYAGGALQGSLAWSLEAHVPGCPTCRAALDTHLDPVRLQANRHAVLTALALPAPGPLERALVAVGVPDHVARLLLVTPSLRRSWLMAVTLVLGVALGVAYLVSPVRDPRGAPIALGLTAGSAMRLVPFLVLVPLLPLAGVVAGFSRRMDPMHDLTVAAAMSGVRLFLLRSAAVLTTSLLPALLAAVALPGPVWLPAAPLLPALAVCAVALAASTAIDPAMAASATGAGWVAMCAGLGVALRSPAVAFGEVGQGFAGVVLVCAAGVLLARRDRLELGWAR